MESKLTSPSKAAPLSDRSTNTHLSNTNMARDVPQASSGDSDFDPKAANMNSMEYHRQVLKDKIESGKSEKGTYVSPSDGIMSPCTKKLSELKGKRFKNAGKPQTLFAKAIGRKSIERMNDEFKGGSPSSERNA
ncbi:uncharacterized protein PADG_02243 [Paracoccidioides brasiliensis Pb18]|uniref:Spo12 family protein n=2 Tax=Paracoccidioides brasiliensis TaxID=121759 RepID=C1G277_PARBD|nr:uncharacterized protein PADG_02243 [Paracoccidioides brasiliensis Pb18]EEH46093.2 hypothetical protein PADG_02243 [Paracoccidioides brasiliensis Pb18]ODH39051.1 hypothetical protein ACO22_02059 [Paracoccidioides brasiliensis]ODH51628.1 hypothetical protein GX48_02298 [Paracoccidioides brasiliensis]